MPTIYHNQRKQKQLQQNAVFVSPPQTETFSIKPNKKKKK